jgi:hypothetical protein
MISLMQKVDNFKSIYNKTHILQAPRTYKMPERFVFKYNKNGYSNYRMFDRKGTLLGTMQAISERVDTPEYYPATNYYYSFYIKGLNAIKRRIGVGKAFIKLARHESYENCCEGRIHLIAQNLKDIKDKPDIFYRKCGFTSSNKYHIEKIDECIKENKPLANLWYQTLMYLPLDVKL